MPASRITCLASTLSAARMQAETPEPEDVGQRAAAIIGVVAAARDGRAVPLGQGFAVRIVASATRASGRAATLRRGVALVLRLRAGERPVQEHLLLDDLADPAHAL